MRKKTRFFLTLPIVFLFLFSITGHAQTQKISGQVKDKNDQPIPFATVQEAGTKNGVTADDKGNFSISVKEGANLIVSAVGFDKITVSAANASSVSLNNTSGELSEVVVTALGIKREKRMLTYSTQEVKGSALVDAKQDNIVNALSGKVAGVQITNSSGQPGSSAQIVIRGNSSLTGDNTALFVIDGIPIDNSEAIHSLK